MANHTISGKAYLPDGSTVQQGDWTIGIHSSNGIAFFGSEDFRAGELPKSVGQDGSLTISLPETTADYQYVAMFRSKDRRTNLGPFIFSLTADRTWQSIIETPSLIPMTPTLVQRAEDALAQALAAEERIEDLEVVVEGYRDEVVDIAEALALPRVADIVSASGPAVVNKHNPVNATAAARALSLPTGQAEGSQISVEKTDSSANPVTITGNIRDTPGSTLTLAWQYECLLLRTDSDGSWWPIAGHKTKTALDAAYKTPLDSLRAGTDSTFETRLAGIVGSAVARFANLAALAATRPADGTVGRTDGFSTGGDGGDAIYRYSSTSVVTADAVTVIMPTVGGTGAGRWLIVTSGRNNVKQYGAKGDGVNALGSITSGSAALTLSSGAFIGTDVGKKVQVIGAGAQRSLSGDAGITAATNILTSPSGAFTFADLRGLITITGAGAAGADLVTSIVSVISSTQVKVGALASTTVASANATITRYLNTTISSVASGVATLAATASATATNLAVYYGTDDTAAINIALNYGTGGQLNFPSGKYHVTALTNSIGKSIRGDNPNHTIIRAIPGGAAATMYSAPQPYEMGIHGIWFDGNGFADYCLNTDWVDTGAPSINCSYRDLRVSGYATIGWSAGRNNDSSFDSILFDAYSDNVALDINAPGGQVMFNTCKFFAAISGRWQSASIVGCVLKGIRITGTDWNVIQMHGGYWYGDLTYHCNLYLAAGLNMYPGSFTGAHIENGFADGAIIGGPGALQSALTFVGCHIFTQGAGLDLVPLVASTVGKAGPTARVMLEGGMIEHLNPTLSATANVIVVPHNTSFGGSYTNSRVEVASTTGGSSTWLERNALRHSEGFGNLAALQFLTGSIPTATDTAILDMPRSGIISIRGSAASHPSAQFAYSRIGSAAGVVTSLGSAGTGGWVVTIPSGNAQSGLTTTITVSHTIGSTVTAMIAVLGF